MSVKRILGLLAAAGTASAQGGGFSPPEAEGYYLSFSVEIMYPYTDAEPAAAGITMDNAHRIKGGPVETIETSTSAALGGGVCKIGGMTGPAEIEGIIEGKFDIYCKYETEAARDAQYDVMMAETTETEESNTEGYTGPYKKLSSDGAFSGNDGRGVTISECELLEGVNADEWKSGTDGCYTRICCARAVQKSHRTASGCTGECGSPSSGGGGGGASSGSGAVRALSAGIAAFVMALFVTSF